MRIWVKSGKEVGKTALGGLGRARGRGGDSKGPALYVGGERTSQRICKHYFEWFDIYNEFYESNQSYLNTLSTGYTNNLIKNTNYSIGLITNENATKKEICNKLIDLGN